jgi:hypothetical protein
MIKKKVYIFELCSKLTSFNSLFGVFSFGGLRTAPLAKKKEPASRLPNFTFCKALVIPSVSHFCYSSELLCEF